VSGKIVHHDPDLVRIRIVGVRQIAHADGKVLRGPLICHLQMAPGSVRVEKTRMDWLCLYGGTHNRNASAGPVQLGPVVQEPRKTTKSHHARYRRHTADAMHGHQQLSLFNAHYDGRCSLPIHVCDAAKSWIAWPPGFFLPVRVLSRMFRGLFLRYLETAAGDLNFFSANRHLHEPARRSDIPWRRPTTPTG
jgi:hypothetical protein